MIFLKLCFLTNKNNLNVLMYNINEWDLEVSVYT